MNSREVKPESVSEFEEKVLLFEKAFDKGLKSYEKKIQSILKSIEDTSKINDIKLKGELIKLNFTQIPKGVSYIEVQNIYDEAQSLIRIELDPKKSVNENMSFYFKKAQKLSASIDAEKERLEVVQKELRQIEEAKAQFLEFKDLEYAVKILNRFHIIKFLSVAQQKPPAKKLTLQETLLAKLKLFYGSSGHKIYVGGSAEENEFVTFQVGKGKDFWLHVEGFPGSHVVIKLKNKSDIIDYKTIKEAAQLALHYSKRRGSSSALVVYTNACHVKKIKGAPKGTVSPHFTKTIKVSDTVEEIKKISENTKKFCFES